MKYIYLPQGVCSTQMNIEINNNKITSFEIVNGCPGNTKAISKLLIGMDVDHAINKLTGIACRSRKTSCPDQIAKALTLIKQKKLLPVK
ncbi:MAG: TIGR03905 family TSCPD domain-containing protein [Mycoplasmataceae bacterium]|jgi:uncharacterized protein (TIGR03905 family)|nr:TIGR03905 family TSCPD domain-containing protein [Mycoplasmataceae bacterium]